MRRQTIGFDRKLDIEWLDATAAMVAGGASPTEVRTRLRQLLEGSVEGKSVKGAMYKTMTVLVHLWSDIPAERSSLRDRAVGLLPHLDPRQRLGVHWALALASYPLFSDIASACGRLLALNDSVVLSQLVRRVAEQWGQRSTLPRAVQRIVRSMVQWGALSDSTIRGVYGAAVPRLPLPTNVAELLLEALLLDAEQDVMTVDQLVGHPALFPFALSITAHDLRSSPRFRVDRQGLDVDMVGLAKAPIGKPSGGELFPALSPKRRCNKGCQA